MLSYKFDQTWDALTLQDFWNDLQFGMEGVDIVEIYNFLVLSFSFKVIKMLKKY